MTNQSEYVGCSVNQNYDFICAGVSYTKYRPQNNQPIFKPAAAEETPLEGANKGAAP